jgi:hypothetical protein
MAAPAPREVGAAPAAKRKLLSRIDDDDKRTAALTTLALKIRSTPPPKPDKGEKA